ncbi:MAG: sugar kinase [Chlorobiaceae bacterium]|jgi:sugar/nucleoside kinase (ribokinase family)|nr:sugar kinase [Chlorobiaceae bacterium]
MNPGGQKKGLFCGLTTVDIIYLVDNPPAIDEKIVALDQLIVAGGPATNAAVAFSALGGKSTLVSVVGKHPSGAVALNDLKRYHVIHVDLDRDRSGAPAFSSVMVRRSTGERSVVSINAVKVQANAFHDMELLTDTDIVLVDGHQMKAAIQLCSHARQKGIPCVMDAGSWKEGSDELLPLIDYVICSERFKPPQCVTPKDVTEYARQRGIRYLAITRGENPLRYFDNDRQGYIEIGRTKVIDTLGAGDILHGAFCYYLLTSGGDFANALAEASKIASFSCGCFGTREWIGMM